MPITGSQKAYKQARSGIARSGTTRSGFYDPNTVIQIGGVTATTSVMPDSLRISKNLNDEIDTCRFTMKPGSLTPTAGQSVVVGAGTTVNREFAGQILTADHRRIKTDDNTFKVFYDVFCADWGRQFDRRLVTQAWYSLSISAIVNEIIDSYTSGFTRNRVEQGLAVVEYFPATNANPSELLRRLAQLAGGGFYIDPLKDVHFFGSNGEAFQSNPLSLTDTRSGLQQFVHLGNVSQVRTRVIVDGMDTRVAAALDAGATVIPIEDASMFNASGGYAVVDQEVLTYTSRVLGGPGSLVGPGVAPPSWLGITPSAGTGIESGSHGWSYTWVTAAGETLPSPSLGANLGQLTAPSTTPTRTLALGTELGTGAYLYAVTFVVGSGETTPGPTGSITTNAGIQPPNSPGAAISNHSYLTASGVNYIIGDSVWVRVTYVDGNGGETDGTDSNTIVVGSIGGQPAAILIDNIQTPSDPNVTLKRIYLNVNGSFGQYTQLAPGNYITVWAEAGSNGTFKVGSDPALERVSLTNIPLGGSGTTARRVYRTTVGGSQLKLVTTINDNTTTTYTDSTADGSLGADVPTSNTTALNQASLSAIAVGPTGTTSRKVYRTAAYGSVWKLVTTIADNTTTTYLDTTPDGSLGAAAPSSDTSGLTQQDGQVNVGSTTLIVAGPGLFSTSGGWALVQGMFVRYTGISGQTLTGIPASGMGALAATVSYGATIVEAPRLTGVPASGAGSLTHAVTNGASIALRVIRNDTSAQATVAVIEGGDGIYEFSIVDHRLSENGAIARGDAELDSFARELVHAQWVTSDLNAQPGRSQTIALTGGSDPISTTVTITRVDLEYQTPDQHPVRSCEGGTLKTPRILDAFVTESR